MKYAVGWLAIGVIAVACACAVNTAHIVYLHAKVKALEQKK